MKTLSVLAVVFCLADVAFGHGRMMKPIQRSSAWRAGYDSPPNYDDDGVNCGGYGRQWDINKGKCGVCGDPWDMQPPREHEAGGKYARGFIVENYRRGQKIEVLVEMTTTHQGYFEFRMCKNDDVSKPITHACLDQHLLKRPDGSTKYYLPKGITKGNFTVELNLPESLTCSQCVMQWKYRAGNSWGTDPDGTECLGCGPQEHFINCADVSIN